MPRNPEKTEQMSPEERRSYARRLREAADAIEALHDVVGHETTAWVFRKPSLVDGLRRVESFSRDARRTINQVIAGRPLKKSSSKDDLNS
ncbi:hypothetical protein LOC67_23560 [Stieleria sp. JC731]|uniref:hypothetical protein n=1 Tax=Pirellulaceae TaxID=2691357 RepID=UPI001E2A5203|nr:hypothetical protein [Stieleria sp. JC731]MCC9603538.1 hypothetical protein [Stieleria sp. JC731]